MSYIAIWLKGEEVVEENEFEDLITAKTFVLNHLRENLEILGVTAVKVCDDRATYFRIEP